jgi:hypothetical protein
LVTAIGGSANGSRREAARKSPIPLNPILARKGFSF